MKLLFTLTLLLAACARQPLSQGQQSAIDQVAAAALLGHELVVNVKSAKLLGSGANSYDVSAWNVNAAFRDSLKAGVEERGRKFVPIDLSQAELEKAAGSRESRWQKSLGKQSQALLGQLFSAADRQGIRYFFLLTPNADRERYALHGGNLGVGCDDAGSPNGRASAYFFFEFALWDVSARKKIFDVNVDPSDSAAMTFADCKAVQDLKEPEKQLEDPVKRTMGLVVDSLFTKMGWKGISR